MKEYPDEVIDRRTGRPRGAIGDTFSPAATTTAPSGDAFNMFDDPATHMLEQVIRGQLGTLARPTADPTRDGLMDFFKSQMGTLSSAAPITFDAPGNFNADNPLLNDFVTEGRKRIGELNERPFTDAEEAGMRTRTRNDALVQRDQASKRATERASARGIARSSGVLEADQQSIDNSFTAADAKNQNDLLMWVAEQIQGRKNQATGISQSLASAGEQQAARAQAGNIAAGQLRLQGQVASNTANQNRQGQIMGLAGALAEMAAQQRGEARARQGDVLSLSTLLAEIPIQRLQTMMSVLNGTGGNNIGSLFNSVATLNNAQQVGQTQQNNATDNFLNGISSLASYYANRGTAK